MRISKIAIVILALLLPLTLQAQKKKKVIKKPVVVVPAEPEEDPRITEMRELTQQIIFIDSLVVPKSEFLSRIQLNAESGNLLTFDTFFRTQDHPDGYVFLNEMGNKCYYSEQDDQKMMRLFTIDKLGDEWSEPRLLEGLYEELSEANYPFMMTDGTTLYFAAKGEESIGGYDIFTTRYDAEDGKFLKPENIGMPFNSEANDYMYCIDEISNIGYFVTDRRQPEDKVCIYTFIPPTTRRTYAVETYSDEQLRGLADISRIADTWGNGKERKLALERLKSINPHKSDSQDRPELQFVINDDITYTSAHQLKSPESEGLFREWQDISRRLEETGSHLQKTRDYYAKASSDDKQALRQEILDTEKLYEELAKGAKELEKKIRNNENNILNP